MELAAGAECQRRQRALLVAPGGRGTEVRVDLDTPPRARSAPGGDALREERASGADDMSPSSSD